MFTPPPPPPVHVSNLDMTTNKIRQHLENAKKSVSEGSLVLGGAFLLPTPSIISEEKADEKQERCSTIRTPRKARRLRSREVL